MAACLPCVRYRTGRNSVWTTVPLHHYVAELSLNMTLNHNKQINKNKSRVYLHLGVLLVYTVYNYLVNLSLTLIYLWYTHSSPSMVSHSTRDWDDRDVVGSVKDYTSWGTNPLRIPLPNYPGATSTVSSRSNFWLSATRLWVKALCWCGSPKTHSIQPLFQLLVSSNSITLSATRLRVKLPVDAVLFRLLVRSR